MVEKRRRRRRRNNLASEIQLSVLLLHSNTSQCVEVHHLHMIHQHESVQEERGEKLLRERKQSEENK